jgi:hypothetical protein
MPPPPPPPEGQKLPPPFPVVAPPKSGKTVPPIPHVSVKVEPPEAEKPEPAIDPAAIAKKKRTVVIIASVVALLVLAGGGFVAYKMFLAPSPPPPPPAAKAKAPVAKTPAVKVVPPTAPAPAPGGAAPSATPIANIPAKAIGKARDAVEAAKASGQSDVSPLLTGDPVADKPAAAPAGTQPAVTTRPAATAQTAVTKSVTASTALEAAVEASPEFRSFVANAKVSGVFQGTPARAFINGRMVRAGETVDATLGVQFEGVDPAKRHLLFKDKAGAVVARRY